MTAEDQNTERGPAQALSTAETLVGRAVDWRDGGAVNGFDVVRDLALEYSPHETFFLALTGDLPSAAHGRAFGVALTWVCPAHIGTAPTHAAALAQISGAPDANIWAIAVLSAGQEAERNFEAHAELFTRPNSDLPPIEELDPPAGRRLRTDWREHLRTASGVDVPNLDRVSSATAAAIVVLHHLGVCSRREFVACWVWARLLGATAEILVKPALDMRSYPLRVPSFEYVE